MPTLIFKLRGVPDDEAEEVRALLEKYRIDYYETTAGNWGISLPALWLQDETEEERAKELISEYQQERYIRVRGEYEQLKKEGKQRRFIDLFKENPNQFLMYIVFILGIAYLSIRPFM